MSHNGFDAGLGREEARVVVEVPLPSYEEAIAASSSADVGFKPSIPAHRLPSPVQNERAERARALPRAQAVSDETRRNSIRRTMATILSGLIFIVFCLILLLRFQRQSCRCPRTYIKPEIDYTETDRMYVSYTRCINEKNILQNKLNVFSSNPNSNDVMKQLERLIRENEALKLNITKAQKSLPQPNDLSSHDVQNEKSNTANKFKLPPDFAEDFQKFLGISINSTIL